MDTGELLSRILIEVCELVLIWGALAYLLPEAHPLLVAMIAFAIVHTWNWVTNGLFWSVIIFTFPGMKNPGAENTVSYLNRMRERFDHSNCITGVAIYGSVSRRAWHDRSDIDIRFLRKKGLDSLVCAVFQTMAERFRALLAKQPMDLYLADDTDFLKKMRSDEKPFFIIARDSRLESLYPECSARQLTVEDLVGGGSGSASVGGGH